jgi:hypothetical protein
MKLMRYLTRRAFNRAMNSRKSRGIGIIIVVELPEEFQTLQSFAGRLRQPVCVVPALICQGSAIKRRTTHPCTVKKHAWHTSKDDVHALRAQPVISE